MLPERVGVGAGKSIDNEFTIWMKPIPAGETRLGSTTHERLTDSVLARDL